MIKDIFKRLMFYVSVPKCVFCGEKLDINDKALCKECLIEYEAHKEMNCPHCSHLYNECACPNKYLTAHGVKQLFKVFKYKAGEAAAENALIFSLKEENRRDVFELCTEELGSAIKKHVSDFNNVIFTNIPRRKEAINRYGYDHAAVISKKIAEKFGAEYRSLLISHSGKSQKTMKKEERLSNVDFALKDESISLSGKTVILVDDIVTTGTSMGVAAMLLRSLGTRKVFGASLAIAYRDDTLIFDTTDRFDKKARNKRTKKS